MKMNKRTTRKKKKSESFSCDDRFQTIQPMNVSDNEFVKRVRTLNLSVL